MIIDADGHFIEPVSLWADYVPTRLRDRIYAEFDGDGWMTRIVIGDYVIDREKRASMFPYGFGDAYNPKGLDPGERSYRRFEQSHPGAWDGVVRLEVHDVEGLDAAVIFPTCGLQLGSLQDPDVALEACRAVNRWSADYRSVAPDELYPVAVLPDHHPELAAEELRRCVTEYGYVAGVMRPNPTVDGRTLDDPSFEVLWNTAEELDVAICVHNGAYPDRPQSGIERASKTDPVWYFLYSHSAVHSIEGMLAFASLYQGRVFERHQSLRVGFMESSCGWAPFWLERLDEHTEILGWMLDPPPPRLPSEVFRDQCVIGCEGEEAMVPYVQERLGDQSVVWASDFPHFDARPPFTADMLGRTDMTDQQKEAVMSQAAIDFYKLDREAIERSTAKRRGSGR